MGGIVHGLPPIKNITQQYMKTGPLPSELTPKMLDILFDWLEDVQLRSPPSKWEHSVVLDRTGVYTMAFLNVYRDNPFITRKTLQLIGIVAFFLADCFFGKDISKSTCLSLCDDAYTDKQFMECLKMYMVSNIEFFGTTFLDTVVISHAEKTHKAPTNFDLSKFRQFNYTCFQYYLFPKDSSQLSPALFFNTDMSTTEFIANARRLFASGGTRRTRRRK
jgi:hypothetical protein